MKASGNLKNNYFSTRLVSLWNKLDKDAIQVDTVDKFKINLSKYGYQKLRVKSGYYKISVFLTTINNNYVMLCYVTLRYVTLCYVMLCYVMLCCVMLCYAMLCYVMLCYVMLCYVMLCYVMLCYVMLCYVMLCYVMLCYVMLCYVMLCYVMLCYVKPTNSISKMLRNHMIIKGFFCLVNKKFKSFYVVGSNSCSNCY